MSSDIPFSLLEFLTTQQADEILHMQLPADPLLAQKALRKVVSPPQAQAIASLKAVRHKTHTKFPAEVAEKILATDKLFQQSSSWPVAKYKAGAFKQRFEDKELIDLCSGMGADAIAASLAGVKTYSFDISPEAVFCSRYNAKIFGAASCEFSVGKAEDVEIPAGEAVHIDPDRRFAGSRSVHLRDYSPGEEFLISLIQNTACGAMKLSPALPREELELLGNVDAEYISTHNVCRQLLAWWPGEGKISATAVLDDSAAAETIFADGELAEIKSDHGRFVVEPDHAVLAAGAEDALAKKLGAWRMHDQLVWLFADEYKETALARYFEILAQVPGREQDVIKELRRRDAGQVELKTRGVQLNTDSLQKKLSGGGTRRLTVLWCRMEHKQLAFIAKRL